MVPLEGAGRLKQYCRMMLTEVFDQEDEPGKSRLLLSLGLRAAESWGEKGVPELVKAYKRWSGR